MKNKLYLGIDTSNYTTSAALVTASGEIVANVKEPLPVAEGARGLRQSDALFAHVKNMPSVMERINALRADGEVVAVGVSTRPRNLEGSYMPCFLAGEASATAVSAAAGIPFYRFSLSSGLDSRTALILVILFDALLYALLAAKFGVIGEDELKLFPKGEKIIKIMKNLRLLRKDNEQRRKNKLSQKP
jgi:hypothetical protein